MKNYHQTRVYRLLYLSRSCRTDLNVLSQRKNGSLLVEQRSGKKMKKKVRPMNLESFYSVSRSSQKWVGTLLFLSSSKGSLLMQQDDSPPSQIRMALVAHKKLDLVPCISVFIQQIGNPNPHTRWPTLWESLRALKAHPKGG